MELFGKIFNAMSPKLLVIDLNLILAEQTELTYQKRFFMVAFYVDILKKLEKKYLFIHDIYQTIISLIRPGVQCFV